MRTTAWKALVTLASVGAAISARKLLMAVWERRTGEEPPLNPADPDTAWRDALLWSAATGALAGVARMLGRRGAAELWAAADGELPADVDAG